MYERLATHNYLHKLIKASNYQLISQELYNQKVSKKLDEVINALDDNQDTPLLLALKLNNYSIVKLLLSYNANLFIKDKLGLAPLDLAILKNNRELVRIIYLNRRFQLQRFFKEELDRIVSEIIKENDDFYLELKWNFKSWLPLVSNLCPSDTYRIWKKGNCLRIDSSLVGFENLRWLRGHQSIIYNPELKPNKLLLINRTNNSYTSLLEFASLQNSFELEEEIDRLMTSKLTNTKVHTSNIQFQQQHTTSIFNYKLPKTEKVDNRKCLVFKVDSLAITTVSFEGVTPSRDKTETSSTKTRLTSSTSTTSLSSDTLLDSFEDLDSCNYHFGTNRTKSSSNTNLHLFNSTTSSKLLQLTTEFELASSGLDFEMSSVVDPSSPTEFETDLKVTKTSVYKLEASVAIHPYAQLPVHIRNLQPIVQLTQIFNPNLRPKLDKLWQKFPDGFPMKINCKLFTAIDLVLTVTQLTQWVSDKTNCSPTPEPNCASESCPFTQFYKSGGFTIPNNYAAK